MDQKESNIIFRGASASDLRHNQDGSRQQQPPPPPPQQPPQKCPRCDSPNTKFCYYNNYSLSQPRYFCKTCRRYWTQGGTLRNVPVGGGCRKGSKRAKTNAAASSSSGGGDVVPPVAAAAAASNSMSISSPYFPGGGFLSSLAAIQSLTGGGADSVTANSGFLQGFGMLPAPFASQIQAQQLFQMDDGIGKSSLSLDNSSTILHRQPTTSPTAAPHNTDWISQGLILSNPSSGGGASAIPTPVDDHDHNSAAGLWSIGTGASAAAASTPAGDGGDNSTADESSSSRWPNIPGYGRQ